MSSAQTHQYICTYGWSGFLRIPFAHLPNTRCSCWLPFGSAFGKWLPGRSVLSPCLLICCLLDRRLL
jgi:hypothetical protein